MGTTVMNPDGALLASRHAHVLFIMGLFAAATCIQVVIEPLLIDEDYYARVEGREIISNLSKAAGLATMIATMRPGPRAMWLCGWPNSCEIQSSCSAHGIFFLPAQRCLPVPPCDPSHR